MKSSVHIAPDFEAETTQGLIKLADYRGKWIVLFSHPGDFTPVILSIWGKLKNKFRIQ